MQFDELLYKINRMTDKELPGAKAHNEVMNLQIRRQIFKDVNHNMPPRESAVLALLYPDMNNKTRLAFILRKTYDGHHAGQIAFPGGKKEVFDTDLIQTALRETHEEIGVPSNQIEIKRSLSLVFIPISNYNVQPFLGICHETPSFKPDPVEVADILELPFAPLVNNDLITVKHSYFGKTYDLKAFKVNNYKIWGATAMILSEISMLFNE